MPETTIKFTTDVKGAITGIEKLGGKLQQLDNTASKTQSGMKGFTNNLANMKAGIDMLTGTGGQIISVISDLNAIGEASRQAKGTLNALTGGNAAAYINELTNATKGWVSASDLAKNANLALGMRLVQTKEETAQLARYGAILGQSFRGDATVGVETLTTALSRVGQTMLLDNLGLSAKRVMDRFNELKAVLGDEQKAWSTAVLEEAAQNALKLEGTLDGAGSGVRRLGSAFDQLKANAGEIVSTVADKMAEIALQAGATYDILVKIMTLKGQQTAATYNQFPNGVPVNYGKDFLTSNNTNLNREMVRNKSLAQIIAMGIRPEDYFAMLSGGGYGSYQARNSGASLTTPNLTSTIYTGFRTVDPNYTKWLEEQKRMERDIAVRRAYRDSGYSGQHETMGSLYAQQAMGRFDVANEFNKSVQAANLLNQIVQGGKNLLSPYATGVNQIATAWQNAGEEARRAQSKAAAFGTGSGGIFGEIGGGMGDLFGQRRAQVEADLNRKYGKGSKKAQAGLDAFDKNAQTAMNAYMIATGQATKASLAFDTQLKSLQERLSAGKIDAKTYATELFNLGNAAAKSGGDFDALMTALGRNAEGTATGGVKSPRKPGSKGPGKGNWTGKQNIGTNSTRDEFSVDAESPFASLQKGLGDLDNGLKGVTDKTTAIPKIAETAFATAAEQVKPYQKVIDTLNSTINQSLALRAGVRITYETLWTGGGTQGGGSGGRKF